MRARAARGSARVSGLWRDAHRDVGQYETAERITTVKADVSRRAPRPAEVPLCVQRRGGHGARAADADPGRPVYAGVCGGRGRREVHRSSPARAPGADDGARGPDRRLADAVGSDPGPGAPPRAHLRGARPARARRAGDPCRRDALAAARVGTAPAAGTVWGVHRRPSPSIASCPGNPRRRAARSSAATAGPSVVDGYAVYEVLARDGPGLRARALLGAHETQVRGERRPLADGVCRDRRTDRRSLRRRAARAAARFPATPRNAGAAAPAAAGALAPDPRSHLDVGDRASRLAAQRFGKAVRYMLERWTGLTRFLDNPRIPLDNNADRTGAARPGRRPEESLRLEVAARHAGRGALLHAVRVGEARGRRPPRVSPARGSKSPSPSPAPSRCPRRSRSTAPAA